MSFFCSFESFMIDVEDFRDENFFVAQHIQQLKFVSHLRLLRFLGLSDVNFSQMTIEYRCFLLNSSVFFTKSIVRPIVDSKILIYFISFRLRMIFNILFRLKKHRSFELPFNKSFYIINHLKRKGFLFITKLVQWFLLLSWKTFEEKILSKSLNEKTDPFFSVVKFTRISH